MKDKLTPNQEQKVIENFVACIMDDLDYYHFDELIIEKYKKELFQFFTKISEEHSLFSPRFDLSNKKNIVNDKEKIKKAVTFTDSFLVRTNTNLKNMLPPRTCQKKSRLLRFLKAKKEYWRKLRKF